MDSKTKRQELRRVQKEIATHRGSDKDLAELTDRAWELTLELASRRR